MYFAILVLLNRGPNYFRTMSDCWDVSDVGRIQLEKFVVAKFNSDSIGVICCCELYWQNSIGEICCCEIILAAIQLE